MDNQRLFTWGLFGLLFFMTWQAWQLDYNTTAPAPIAASTTTSAVTGVPESGVPDVAPTPVQNGVPSLEPANTPTAAIVETPSAKIIQVKTDVLDLEIDLRGGDIVSAETLKYPVAKDRPDELIRLLSRDPADYGRFETGLVIPPNNAEGPTHFAAFSAPKTRYELGSADELIVPLTWTNNSGVVVTKSYRFTPGSYRIDLAFDVNNESSEPITATAYARIVETAKQPERSMVDVETYSFDGPVVFNGDSYDKIKIDDLEDGDPQKFSAQNGWIAAIEHHFLAAVIPPQNQTWAYDADLKQGYFSVKTLGTEAAQTVSPGSRETLNLTLFVGPKLQSQLAEIAPKLTLTVDYGILTLLAQPLFWLLDKVHSVVLNWGFAIILVTFIIKLLFYRLTAASGRSMAKMRSLQPRMKKLQERYKDDRPALSREMMDLYKREKVNPAAGCLPILVQMPFFLAFYWVLLESVEMRQAPFMLWINDLSSKDPFFVLPLLMGGAMFFQQRLNPAPADPIQAKVMSVLPVVFTVFFAFFPAGLVLYWLTNTLLSIAQQWRINKLVESEEKAKLSH